LNTGWKINDVAVLAENPWARAEIRTLQHATGPTLPDFLVYSLKDFVQVVGITPAGHIVLVKEDRKVGGWSVEAIAGDIQDNESPVAAASREWSEETDFSAGAVVYLGPHQPDTNRGASLSHSNASWTGHLCVAIDLAPEPPRRAASEIIESVVVSFADALNCALHPNKKLPGLNLPILSTGTRLIITSISLRPELYTLIR